MDEKVKESVLALLDAAEAELKVGVTQILLIYKQEYISCAGI